jgi:2-oxoglutarate ferredoxin oxidoreductase subunit alpha
MPYERDEKLSRPWAVPGTKGLEHRIGGLEKQNITGNISYDPENHEFMVKLRAEKIERIANYIPDQQIDNGPEKGDVLLLGWGGTYGALKTATRDLLAEGLSVAHAHLRYINPMPKNLEQVLRNYKHVLVPELNSGQLVRIIRDRFLIDAKPYNKVQGQPFTTIELKNKVKSLLGV